MVSSSAPNRLQPFGETLKALRKDRDLTLERLAFRVYDVGGKITAGAISQFERGASNPTIATIELLAKALEVEPETFVAYRLAIARRLLDERQIPLEEAVANLALIEPTLAAAELAPGDAGPVRMPSTKRLREAALSEPDETKRPTRRAR